MIAFVRNYLRQNWVELGFLVVVILLVFYKLPQTGYQQDEWHGLGLAFSKGSESIFNGIANPLDLVFAKGRILSSAIYYWFLKFFPFQNIQIAFFAILLHTIATILVYSMIEKFIKNRLIALLGAILFAVNSVSQGSVTWAFVAISTVGATIFVLLGIICFFKYIEGLKKKWLVFMVVLLYVSLWFKETSLYLFLFLPASIFLFKKTSITAFIRNFWILIVPFLLIIFYRIVALKLRTTESNLYITGQSENFFSIIVLRTIFYPLTSFSLMFVPGDQFLALARTVLNQIYPFLSSAPNNPLIVQTVVLDLLSVVLSFLILGLIFVFLKNEKRSIKKIVIFWLLFTFLSFLPYVVLSKDFSYLESRYYYMSVVGGAFIFSWLLKRSREAFGLLVFFLVILPLCCFFLVFHANIVREKIKEQVLLTDTRQDFVTQQKKLLPTLNRKKNVIFISSDRDFWAEGNKIPFQQGTGYTLMVLYYESDKIPKQLLKDQFLFDIGSQGYQEVGEHGFGYFWDLSELEKVIKKENLSHDSVVRFYYDSQTRQLTKLK